jgi:nitrogen fixation NifU-like protein
MNAFDDLYRENILDHYKSPRNQGVIEGADAEAEGQNPLCGDEIAMTLKFQGDVIEDIKFRGRGCAISQAATSMLTEMVKGSTAAEVMALSRDEIRAEVGVPLSPVRLKCALLGLGVLKVALHRARGTPLPEEWAGIGDLEFS